VVDGRGEAHVFGWTDSDPGGAMLILDWR